MLSAATTPPGDVDWVLCLDLNGHVMSATSRLQEARARGTGVATNVFDLLPWSRPEWWPPGSADATFVPWVHHALAVSDVLLVNSRATAVDLERFVALHRPQRPDGFAVQSAAARRRPRAHARRGAPRATPTTSLVVGTVEPRKGHARCSTPWSGCGPSGTQVRLTVVGRAGWMVDDVVARMQRLDREQPLFAWLKNAPDGELHRLYGTFTAAVVATEGEGFGLPVVEAAVRGCPVVLRDLPGAARARR